MISPEAEKICEKYGTQNDFSFAFKASQKESPFIILFLIFVLTCICFGHAVRCYERYYWETQAIVKQEWTYLWNAMWAIFVTLTTGINKFINFINHFQNFYLAYNY